MRRLGVDAAGVMPYLYSMTTSLLLFANMFANAIGAILSTDNLLVLTNAGIVITTLISIVVMTHESNKTVRDVTKSDDRLIAKLLAGWAIEPVAGKHKADHIKRGK